MAWEKTGRLTVQTTLTGDTLVQSRLEGLSRTIGLFNSIIVQASISTFVFSIIQRGVRHSAERVRDAQERYNEALAEGGRFSKETMERQRELQIAQEDYNMALIQQNIQYLTLAGSIVVMIANTVQLLSSVQGLTAAFLALGTARQFALGGIVGGIAGLGIGIAIGAVHFGGGEPNFDRAGNQFSRRLKQEYRRQRRGG